MSDLWRYENETWTLEYGRYNLSIDPLSPGPRASSILVCNQNGNLLLYGGADSRNSIF